MAFAISTVRFFHVGEVTLLLVSTGLELPLALLPLLLLLLTELTVMTGDEEGGGGDLSRCMGTSTAASEVALRSASNAMFCSKVGPVDGLGESVARSMSTVDGSMPLGSTEDRAVVIPLIPVVEGTVG